MKKVAGLLLLFVLLGSVIAAAQSSDPIKAPKYLWIQTEQIKAEKTLPYMKLNRAFKEAMGQSNIFWLGEYAVAGNGGEYTFVCFMNTGADIDKALAEFNQVGAGLQMKNAALAAEGMSAVTGTRSVLARFEPNLSINAEKVDHAKVTRVWVHTVQLRLGTRPEFVEYRKQVRDLHLKANDNAQVLVYSIMAGADNPSFLLINPMSSLADMDEPPSPAYAALLTPEIIKHFEDVVKQTLVSRHSAIYAIDPMLSRVPQSYVAANPGFWAAKEPVVAQTGKKVKKAIAPAAIKEKEKK